MSKIIFLGTPAHGHVNPTLPVVKELVRRGEEVIYYNAEEFRPKVESTGATFQPYPDIGLDSDQITERIKDGKLINVATLILSGTERMVPPLLEELQPQQPDVILFDSMALWGRIATTILDVHSIASITHFVFEGKHIMEQDGHALRYLWQALPKLPKLMLERFRLSRRYKGAFPKGTLIPVRGDLNIIYTLRELQPESPMIDDTYRFVGPSIDPQTRHDDFPFDTLEQEFTVYISLGTVHYAQAQFYRECFAAFGELPAQFVLSAGKDTDIASLGEIPANFLVRPSVPQLELLQHVDVFITHGGMNSIHEGLYYGVPLIVIPYQIEQLLNARNVERLGAEIVIDKRVAGKAVTAQELREALQTIRSNESYRSAAQSLKDKLQATGGYQQAADEIQKFLAEAIKQET